MQAVGSASDQPLLKLCDFGQAAMIGEGRRLRRKCGTEQYMAPEVLDAELGGALGCERTQPPHDLLGVALPLLLVRPSSPVQACRPELLHLNSIVNSLCNCCSELLT